MCVVAIAHLASDRYPLIVAANRDERHARASTAAGWWADGGDILGGRDLVAGGTWLGLSTRGRFAAVTNIFEGPSSPARHSRGALVDRFLRTPDSAADYAGLAAAHGEHYAPFNLLLLAAGRLYFSSNRNPTTELAPGIHSCSNNRPGTDWPKLASVRDKLRGVLDNENPADCMLELLGAPDVRGTLDTAPDSIFIVGREFGTRCSTVLAVDADGSAKFIERQFGADGNAIGTVAFEFPFPQAGAAASPD